MQIIFADVSFAASAPTTLKVSGCLTYKYKNSMSGSEKTAPLENYTVKLYDQDIGHTHLMGTTKTDSNGNFIFGGVNANDGWLAGGLDLYFVVKAEDEFSYVMEDGLFKDTTEFKSKQVDNITKDYNFGNVNIGLNGAFHIVNTIHKAADTWIDSKPNFGCYPPKIKVIWRNGEENGGTRCGKDTMYVQATASDSDQWDANVILHEYGHFLMRNFAESPKGTGLTHVGSGIYNKGLAYSEGWATYFGQYVDGSPNYSDSSSSSVLSGDIELPNPNVPNEANEYANSATLWDITDSTNEAHDSLTESFTYIQNLLHQKVSSTGKYNQGLCDLWKNWFANGYAKGKEYEIWKIFNNHGMQFDNEPPKVSFKKLVSPKISADTEVEVNASDNIKVEKIEFYVDGVLKSTCKNPPYKFLIKKKDFSKGKHILQAKAYDPAGASQTTTNSGFQMVEPASGKTSAKPILGVITNLDFVTNTLVQQIRLAFGVAYQPFIIDDGEDALAVTQKGWDDIGSILTGMGKSFSQITDESLLTYDNIKNYDSIFLNCNSSASRYSTDAASSIKKFVEEGGTIYASDYAYAYVKEAFPGYLLFPDTPTIGSAQKVNAIITDLGMANYIGMNNIEINYDLGSWVVIDSVSSEVTTHVKGSYYDYSSNDLKTDKPLLVSFPYGKGKVIYTTFHNERQLASEVTKILEYLVLKVTQNIPESNVNDVLNSFDYSMFSTMFSTLDQNEESQIFKFSCKEGRDYILTMDSYGGYYNIDLYKPDGNLYATIENPTLSNGIQIMNPEAGEWGYKVSAKEVYFEDTPFVVGIGEKLRAPSIANLSEQTNKKSIDIEGSSPGYAGIELKVENGENSSEYNTNVYDSKFIISDVLLSEGRNELTVSGSVYNTSVSNSVYGDTASIIREYVINCDFTNPQIILDNEFTENVFTDTVEISGSVSEDCIVSINDEIADITYGKAGTAPHFNLNVNLIKGENVYTIKATDKAGNESIKTLRIIRDDKISYETNAPKIVSMNLSDNQVISDDYTVKIIAEDESNYTIIAAIDDIELSSTNGNEFLIKNQNAGQHLFSCTIIDRWNNATIVEVPFYINVQSSTSESKQVPTSTPIATPTTPTNTPASGNDKTEEPGSDFPSSVVFTDSINHWAKDYIDSLYSKKIISGYPDGTIKPNNEITRAEMAVILAEALGLDAEYAKKAAYKDIDDIPEFAIQAVNALSEKGIFVGYEDGSFRPNNKITRAELITSVAIAYKIEPVSTNNKSFVDSDVIPSWAAGHVNAAVVKGIIKGYSDGTFKPQNNIKRGEAFAVISNCLELSDGIGK